MVPYAEPRAQGRVVSHGLERSIALVATLCLAGALAVAATTPPAAGYEPSLYQAFPLYFWVLLMISFAGGVFILLYEAFVRMNGKLWAAGLALLMASNALLFLLPAFRGYAALGWFGPLKHVGHARDILFTGHLVEPFQQGENFYPALHLVMVAVHYVTGLSLEDLTLILPSIYFIVFVVSLFLLGRAVSTLPYQALVIVALGGLPLYVIIADAPSHAFLMPRGMFFSLIPLVIYLFYRRLGSTRRTVSYSLCLILIVVAAPFYHSFDGGLFLPLLLVSIGLTLQFYGRGEQHPTKGHVKGVHLYPKMSPNYLALVLIPFVVWFLWFSAFHFFEAQLEFLRSSSPTHPERSEASGALFRIERMGISSIDAARAILMRLGHQFFYFLPAAIISIATWIRLLLGRHRPPQEYVVFSVLLGVCALTVAASAGGGFAGGINRPQPYAVLFSAILLAAWACRWAQKVRPVTAASVITLLAVLPLLLGTFNTYNYGWPFGWPFNTETNLHVTKAEMVGMEWFLHSQDPRRRVEDTFGLDRLGRAQALAGWKGVPANVMQISLPLRHFGYDQDATYGASLEQDAYFLSSTASRMWEQMQYPKSSAFWYWSPADHERLDEDRTVSWIYTNGGFEVYAIQAMKPIVQVPDVQVSSTPSRDSLP